MKMSQINNRASDLRTISSGNLAKRFNRNPRLVKKFDFQNEKTLGFQYRQRLNKTEYILLERKIRQKTRIFFMKQISGPSK